MSTPDRDSTRHVLGCQGTQARRSSSTPSTAPRCARRTGGPPGGRRSTSFPAACLAPLSSTAILAVVAAAWDISVSALCGPSRQPSLVSARQAAVYLARNMLGLSWAEAANLVGRSDHTTAMSGYRRISAELAQDARLATRLDWIIQALGLTP